MMMGLNFCSMARVFMTCETILVISLRVKPWVRPCIGGVFSLNSIARRVLGCSRLVRLREIFCANLGDRHRATRGATAKIPNPEERRLPRAKLLLLSPKKCSAWAWARCHFLYWV